MIAVRLRFTMFIIVVEVTLTFRKVDFRDRDVPHPVPSPADYYN